MEGFYVPEGEVKQLLVLLLRTRKLNGKGSMLLCEHKPISKLLAKPQNLESKPQDLESG